MVYFIMPTNLPPEYFDAEKKFRQSTTPAEKIAALEELIGTVPKHKGTDKLRADLRAKLSRLRDEAIRKKKAGKGDLYTVDREGALQVALVGFPNSGKSSLLKSLTNAAPIIAEYPMSTVMPLSGMMPYEDIQFQLVDLPPLGNESTDGWVSGILRNADLLLFVIDLSEEPAIQAGLLFEQMEGWRIPIMKKGQGIKTRESGSPIPKNTVVVANKVDLPGGEEGLRILRQEYENSYPVIGVSAMRKLFLEDLKRSIFEAAHIIRVYSKEPGKEPDLSKPFTLPSGSTVLELAEMIHKEFVAGLRYACIWGSSRFPGQRIQKDYILHDKDIVEFHV